MLLGATALSLAFSASQSGVLKAECTAFEHAQIDRADFYLRAILNSNAFATCMNDRLSGRSGTRRYMPSCAHVTTVDPSGATTLASQVDNIRRVVYAGNYIVPNCTHSGGFSATTTGPGDTWNSQSNSDGIFLNDNWGQAFADWSTLYLQNGYNPWNYRSAELLHEFMHEHFYDDRESGPMPCPRNSANYILSDCVAHVIEQSPCGANSLDACTDPDEIMLPGAWDSSRDAPDENQRNCVCVRGIFQRIGLETSSGARFLSSVDRGGGNVDAHAIGFGSWETIRVIDLTQIQQRRVDMADGDFVQFRAPNGRLWRAHDGRLSADCTESVPDSQRAHINTDLSTRRPSDPCTFQIHKIGGDARIINGSQISIETFNRRFLSATRGGGGTVTTNQQRVGASETFTVRRPRRAWFVSIQSQNGSGNFLAHDANGALTATATSQSDAAAFWIVDHNGGSLLSGEQVSLESDLHLGDFVQTCTNGTGAVRADANTMRGCSKFVITRTAGRGQIRFAEDVFFTSLQEGKYLTADPPAFGGTVWNNREHVRAWEKFRLIPYSPTAGPPFHPPWPFD